MKELLTVTTWLYNVREYLVKTLALHCHIPFSEVVFSFLLDLMDLVDFAACFWRVFETSILEGGSFVAVCR
jgi:hypothetical protein